MLRHTLRRSSLVLTAPRREFATKTLFTAQALVKGGRADGVVTSDDGNLSVTLDLPKGMGGAGKHTNPEQLFAAGYAGIARSFLKRKLLHMLPCQQTQ
jgi:hypothetical protein